MQEPSEPGCNTAHNGWQDPSADLENVNAAYRIERDDNERLRKALEQIRDGDYCPGARNIAAHALHWNQREGEN